MSAPALAGGARRVARAALLLLLALAVTGALAVIFYRPYGPDVRAQLGHGHWGLRVALATGLHHTHRVAAWALGAAVAGLILLARRRGGLGSGRAPALVAGTLLFLISGLVTPWERLLPWSPTVAANMARPMPLGQQGPFAELVGVNMRYDDAQFTLLRRRFGPKAAGRVYFTHVLVLPVLAVIGAALLGRHRRDPGRA